MRVTLAYLSLLAATTAAVVSPRQDSSATIPADAPLLSASSSWASVDSPTAIPYVAPFSPAIGVDTIGQAKTKEADTSSNAKCTRQTFQVPVNVTQPSFDTVKMGVEPEVNQTRITELFVEYATSSQNFTQAYLNGSHIVERTFTISGVYCEPTSKHTAANGAIQLLIHGIGADSRYRFQVLEHSQFKIQPVRVHLLSYVYRTHEAGYATFRYDRLGTGLSERPADGYNLVQASVEAAILENLAQRIRQTTDIGGRAWSKTVVVGHSYGSAQSQHLSQVRPELIDALVLTGLSTDFTGYPFCVLAGVWTQAGIVFPDRYANISKHWLVTGTQYAQQINYDYPPSVTPNATAFVRSHAAPVTQGAFFTIGDLVAPAPNYKGPVQ
ncbi:unnamed protein product [Tilletia controversa]|uniref:AB hydrolase-1 domain-containing protein n=1 Tax=Tilletia controversa TaxID=13291 RepID=A0A8X7MQZ5_9BASI|nr:hypothetical protein CF328_g4475 [Tilletia controversa]KAE8246010.1 hypothetical protein A4X06_0g5254 [Tilletia controversa]CAD6980703.1 unnamed protein product [Tilletia controversa]